MFYNKNNLKKLLYFCLIRCRFEVWKTKTNLIFFSSMVFFLFLLLSVLFLIFCHLFFNFLVRLFYCISLFCFMFKCLTKSFYDETYGWKDSRKMDDGTDGWKASWKRTTTSFNICNKGYSSKPMSILKQPILT